MKLTIQDNLLLCPQCGFEFTHMDNVVLYGREIEDSPVQVINWDGGTEVKTSKPRASSYVGDVWVPETESPRRQSIALLITCESHHVTWLHFAQHKGQTFVSLKPAKLVPGTEEEYK